MVPQASADWTVRSRPAPITQRIREALAAEQDSFAKLRNAVDKDLLPKVQTRLDWVQKSAEVSSASSSSSSSSSSSDANSSNNSNNSNSSDASYFLGVRIIRNQVNRYVTLAQDGYTDRTITNMGYNVLACRWLLWLRTTDGPLRTIGPRS